MNYPTLLLDKHGRLLTPLTAVHNKQIGIYAKVIQYWLHSTSGRAARPRPAASPARAGRGPPPIVQRGTFAAPIVPPVPAKT